MVTGIATGPVTIDELNAQVKHANEVVYLKRTETAEGVIEKLQALEVRNGRLNTQFKPGKSGRYQIIFVDRSQN